MFSLSAITCGRISRYPCSMNILKISVVVASVLFLSGCISGPILLAGAAGAGGTVAGNSVPISQQWDDLSIKSEIDTIITNTPGAQGANVEVTVFNGIALLLGQVPTTAMKNHIATEASKIAGVVIVYNQITVGKNIAFGRFADDSWITSKIKANMLGQVNPLYFKVVTQEGVVYLLGQVTQVEGNQAADIAAQTSGVQKVVKIFNYIAPASSILPVISSHNEVSVTPPAVTPYSASIASPQVDTSDIAVAPMGADARQNTANIPEYAPHYDLASEEQNAQVGPAASD